MRQRYNQTLETMNATVVEQVDNDAGGDGSNMDEGKKIIQKSFLTLTSGDL